MLNQALVKRGVYLCDIARQWGVHPKTVSRALGRGSAPSPTRRTRRSVLDPYRAQINQLLAQGVWNAAVILLDLQSQGCTGEISIVRDYIRPKRALRPSRATVRSETALGQQLHGDWGTIRTVLGGLEVDVHLTVHTSRLLATVSLLEYRPRSCSRYLRPLRHVVLGTPPDRGDAYVELRTSFARELIFIQEQPEHSQRLGAFSHRNAHTGDGRGIEVSQPPTPMGLLPAEVYCHKLRARIPTHGGRTWRKLQKAIPQAGPRAVEIQRVMQTDFPPRQLLVGVRHLQIERHANIGSTDR